MYDYVIVGAGSAGCVVAYRLGEDPDVRIAVIEAGPPDDDPEIHMPARVRARTSRADWDWALVSEPEPGLDFRRNYLPRGRVVGGVELAQRDDLHPRQPRSTTTSGRRWASRAGATRTSCRTSSAPRTTSAAPAATTASAAR